MAAIYKDGTYATIYDALSGEEIYIVDFTGKHQSATLNEELGNAKDNFMDLNADGSLLGVSFSDGSIHIINLNNEADSLTVLDTDSDYTHFEGDFTENILHFLHRIPSLLCLRLSIWIQKVRPEDLMVMQSLEFRQMKAVFMSGMEIFYPELIR